MSWRTGGLDRWARHGCVALALALAGCATPIPSPEPAAVQPPSDGQILGRNDRFIIYDPSPDDTLASVALHLLGSADRRWVIADFNDIDHLSAGRPIVVPLAPINPVAVRTNEYQTVPILCYHRFGPAKGKMIVSPVQFAAQLDWLERNDYRVIPMKQLIGFLAGKETIPKRAVVITVDDGHESAYQYAVPLLRKHGYPATFFIYTDYIGGSSAMTWPQLKEMSASGEFDIGAHSKSHRNLIVRAPGETDSIYQKNMNTEVHMPVDILRRELATPIRLYAFPYGDANDIVLNALTKDDIELAATVTAGGNPFFAQPTLLHRTMIFGEYDLETFKSKLQVSHKLNEP
jgi:peptidoglycan/xylan/chitin deacetylase (PgdA/CDA1 family)